MKFFVRAKPGARKNAVEKVDESHLNVFVKARARDGKANEAIEKLLAEHFGVSKSRVSIARGHKIRQKVVTVMIEGQLD